MRIQKRKILAQVFPPQSEFLNLVSLWTEQQTPTPQRPLAVPLNSSLLFPTIFLFCSTDLFFVALAQIFFSHNLLFRDSTFPSLAEGGMLTKMDTREDIEQVGEKIYEGEKLEIKRGQKRVKYLKNW